MLKKITHRKQVIPQPRLLSHFKRFYKQGRCQLSDCQHSSAIVFQFFYISTPVYERKWFYLILRRLRLGLGLFINCCLFVFHIDSNSTEDLCPDFIYLLLFVFPSAFQMINNKCRKHSYYHTSEPH